MTLNVIYPRADTDSASNVALRVQVGLHTLLIAPGLRADDLARLLQAEDDLTVEAAVLPSSFDEALINRLAPREVVMFVGRSSREQPDPNTLKMLDGIPVLRTDERGTIEFILDGEALSVTTER